MIFAKDFSGNSLNLGSLANCVLCPHRCGVNRIQGELGFCRAGADFSIASICRHKGEEPVISGQHGICNVFFAHCNLQCIYCQNYQISNNANIVEAWNVSLHKAVSRIVPLLENGCQSLGFVSPGHFIPQMLAIIDAVKQQGFSPVIVYNTNAYDRPETLRNLEGIVDVFLPDFKYIEPEMAYEYSGVRDYPECATGAIKEMFRQKGKRLFISDEGLAESGVIIRHLVLPTHVEESIRLLQYLADEFGTRIHLSIMAQYYPTGHVANHAKLNRRITPNEYQLVIDEMERLGFENGWVQQLESSDHYLPDFNQAEPFK
jgi:putative pyruvate formate lyase activating enzyme